MAGPELDNVEDVYPLTSLQQGMLFHALADPAASVFNHQMTVRLEGNLDPAALREAAEGLISRHAALRTAFLWDGLEQPLQVVREQVELEWRAEDWSSLDTADQERRLAEFLERDRERGIDPATAPLTRMALITTGPDSWFWVWTTHHLIADGWSMGVMLAELFSDMAGTPRDGGRPPFRFRDFVAFQAGRDAAAAETYWRSILAGFSNPHRLEVPGAEAAGSGYGSHSIRLDGAASDRLRQFAREQRVTVNTLFLGAWAIVLARWMRTRDVVFGVTTSGREATLPGIEEAVGLFINTLPARVDVAPGGRLGEWLRSLQQQQLQSRPFEQSSLAEVQRWSDIAAGDALFESIYVFENLPATAADVAAAGVTVSGVEFVEHSNYPLAVLVHPEAAIEIQLIYDSARLADDAVVSLGAQLARVLEQYPGNADSPLNSLDPLPDEALPQLKRWEVGPDAAGEERLIHEIIADVARCDPAAVAAISEGRNISYGRLIEEAAEVAGRLRAAGVGRNELVGLLVPRSIDMLVGMLGILQAGGAYVPLDPGYPESHISLLLESDQIGHVVTDADSRHRVPAGVGVVMLGDDAPVPAPVGPIETTNDDYAYLIHTSGSTGRPKGVPVTHRNLVSSTLARDVHYGESVGRFLLLSSFGFDSSVAGIFWTLCSGGALVLPGPGKEHDAAHLLSLASDHRVTHLLCLPSLYQLLLEHDDGASLSDLRVAIVAGEACPPQLLDTHQQAVPAAELHNEYGPTEATVWCTVHRARASDRGQALPIGRPIAGTRIYVLDEYGHRVPPGFAGEIAVAGAGLTDGYHSRPDLTAERFLSIDLDGAPERLYRTGDLGCFNEAGELLFLGRVDAQLKVRGHRIEPGAVEAVLRTMSQVADAAVTGRFAGRSSQLVAFVIPAGDGVDVDRLRSDLREVLPQFMLPDVVVPLESLPRLPNGKVDYANLPEVTAGPTAGYVAPRNDLEVRMAALWADLLGHEPETVGADADYFALGGDSLLAIRLMSAVHREFGTTVPLAALLEAPRLGDLCRRIGAGSTDSAVLVPIRSDGSDTVFMIHPSGGNVLVYEPLARHLPEWIRPIGVQAYGIDGSAEPDRTVGAMAARYAAAIDTFQPVGPVHLLGHSTGGLVAFETARALTARGRQVGVLALLDTLYPLGSSLSARLARQVRTVLEGGWRGVRTVAYWYRSTLSALAGRLRHGPKWRYLLWRGRPLPSELAAKRVNHIALRAQLVYQPQPYSGVVTYVRAAGDEDLRVQASARLWESVADAVVVRPAPGHHTGEDSIVNEPHVGVVAEIIAAEVKVFTRLRSS